MHLDNAIQTFILYIRANGFSTATINIYHYGLHLLFSQLGNPLLKDVTSADLLNAWAWLRTDYVPKRRDGKTHPLAGRSLENIWTAMRSFFNWAISTERLKKRPDLIIERPRYAENPVQPLTTGEITRLLECARRTRVADTTRRSPFTMPRPTAKRDIAIIMLLTDTGVRVSECARLTRSDINFDIGEITVQPFGTGRKTKMRILAIGRQTRLALWDYLIEREEKEGRALDPDEPFFLSMTGRPMNKDSIRQLLTDLGKAAGVPHVHPHRFRHTFASESAAADMTEFNLMQALGHSTNRMASRYVHLNLRLRKHVSVMDQIKKKS